MNKIFSIMLILSFLTPANIFAQPLREETPEWDLSDEDSGWDPDEMEIDVGDVTLKIWIMKPLVPSPISGYLLKKRDFGDMKRILDNLEKETKRIKEKERLHCDERLAEKDLTCKNLNKELIEKIDVQLKIIDDRDKSLKDLKSELFWTKIIAGAVVLGLSGFSIYTVAK